MRSSIALVGESSPMSELIKPQGRAQAAAIQPGDVHAAMRRARELRAAWLAAQLRRLKERILAGLRELAPRALTRAH